ATACRNDELLHPANLTLADARFERYVAMGNSITAGFQSGGINDSTQLQSYAVLLARQMGTPFFAPLMSRPGCPAPFTNVFTGARVPPPVPGGCALRRAQTPPPPYMNNVAVPGAEVMDAIANLDTASNANALTTFFLGGQTQTEAMQRVRPTFLTVWIGNNDVLGAATFAANAGDSTRITPVATFQTRYDQMLDSIDAMNPRGAVLLGVTNVTVIPFFSRGSTYYGLDQAPGLPLTATTNCAPPRGDSVLVPFPFGAQLLATAGTLDCTEPQTIQPGELVKLVTTVTSYNAHIQSEAATRGWAYFDPNQALDSLRLIPTQIAPFPNFGPPATPTPCSASPFGLAFSCDAVHPSASTHKLLANKLIEAINAAYGTTMARIP
ncbi:MAG: SGNH/GDSL hydrolase family protein, partial [Gemmatimonadales bacterium]